MQVFSNVRNPGISRAARPAVLIFAVLVAGLIFPTTAGQAQQSSGAAAGARSFVAEVGRQAVETLPARRLGRPAARAAFQKLLRARFDVAGIARRVFADEWQSASGDQRKEAQELYEKWVTDGLMNLLGRHTGETFRLLGAKATKKINAGQYVVGSEIRRPGGERVRVDWSVRRAGQSWLITNLRTPDGGDLVATHRAEFRMILEQAPSGAESTGLEYIIEELRIRTAP
ncbi:MAG: ABC transporter substrate-binding protein [bacterium]|nr:ABC transporter substrate-binding protein [bacterium]